MWASSPTRPIPYNMSMNIDLLRCPLCHTALTRTGGSLRCAGNHTYDVARKGYVNFANAGADAHYGKALWQARRQIFDAGFFDPLLSLLQQTAPPGVLLDAGCGEGSILRALRPDGNGIGADLARDAVALAAPLSPTNTWLVADLAHLPLTDNSCDAVVNILSPAAYAEFRRVLRPGGALVKAVPGPRHLEQLRRLWQTAEKAPQAADYFQQQFPSAKRQTLTYTKPAGGHLAALCAMTPLGVHRPAPAGIDCTECTFDFIILTA